MLIIEVGCAGMSRRQGTESFGCRITTAIDRINALEIFLENLI